MGIVSTLPTPDHAEDVPLPAPPVQVVGPLLELRAEVAEWIAEACAEARGYAAALPDVTDFQTTLIARLSRCLHLLAFPLAPALDALLAEEAAASAAWCAQEAASTAPTLLDAPFPLTCVWRTYSGVLSRVDEARGALAAGTTTDAVLEASRQDLLTRLAQCAAILHAPRSDALKQRYQQEKALLDRRCA